MSTEQRLAIPKSWGKFQRAIGQVEFMNNQAKAVVSPPSLPAFLSPFLSLTHPASCVSNRAQGGQTLPRLPPSQAGPRRTHVEVKTFSLAETQTILARCKAQGVTIAHAAFAVVNMAWARAGKKDGDDLPLSVLLLFSSSPLLPALSLSLFHVMLTSEDDTQDDLLGDQPPRRPPSS